MEEKKNYLNDKNQNINNMLAKLANTHDIKSYKNKVLKFIEDNNKRIMVSAKNDKKTQLLLTRTFYLNEFDKIENVINNEELLNQKHILREQQYLQLVSYLNILFIFEDLYINKTDIYRSLILRNRIINIIKKYLINKIG